MKAIAIFLLAVFSLSAVEFVRIKKADYQRLVQTNEECIQISENEKLKLIVEQVAPNKIRVELTVAKDLKYFDDLIYETFVKYDRPIKNITKDGEDFTIHFHNKQVKVGVGTKVKWFLYGVGTAVASLGVYAIINSLKSVVH